MALNQEIELSQEEIARYRLALEESFADTGPGLDPEPVFEELLTRYRAMAMAKGAMRECA